MEKGHHIWDYTYIYLNHILHIHIFESYISNHRVGTWWRLKSVGKGVGTYKLRVRHTIPSSRTLLVCLFDCFWMRPRFSMRGCVRVSVGRFVKSLLSSVKVEIDSKSRNNPWLLEVSTTVPHCLFKHNHYATHSC